MICVCIYVGLGNQPLGKGPFSMSLWSYYGHGPPRYPYSGTVGIQDSSGESCVADGPATS